MPRRQSSAAWWLQVLSKSDIRYRYNSKFLVSRTYITTYCGGSSKALFAPSRDQYIWFDDFRSGTGSGDSCGGSAPSTSPSPSSSGSSKSSTKFSSSSSSSSSSSAGTQGAPQGAPPRLAQPYGAGHRLAAYTPRRA